MNGGADPRIAAGRLEAIWIKRVRRGPMDAADRAVLVAGSGIVGNANQGGRRQVTVIEREIWDRLMAELGGALPGSARRANLMISGVPLRDSRGSRLLVGEVEIEILGETRPCERMDEALPGLREAMAPPWFGGAFGAVINDGEIRIGDAVELRTDRAS